MMVMMVMMMMMDMNMDMERTDDMALWMYRYWGNALL